MVPVREEEQLQRIAELHQERARLRALARASIVWGLINMVLGVIALQDHPINLILVLIGLLFVGIAVYRLTTFPRLDRLFRESFADADLQRMDELLRYVSHAKPKEAHDLITF
jgi:hypothetical protein